MGIPAFELDEGFPPDKEFWETLKKIALAWNKDLRSTIIKSLQDKGFTVEWFKWGCLEGFPVLVVKLNPIPNPKEIWGIVELIEQLIDKATDCGAACIIHP
jgi:hypothetical protein